VSIAVDAVADRPEQVTGEWLTEALRAAGHRFRVSEVSFERVGSGQMGTTYRLHLRYRGPKGPGSLVVKMAGEDEASRALVAPGYAAEVGFYTELAPRLAIRVPRCWYGVISPDHTRFTLLLDDASPSLPGIQAEGCTVEQAASCLRNLIGLHAPTWNDPGLWELAFLMRSDAGTASMMAQVMSTATDAFLERYAEDLNGEDRQTLHDVLALIERWQLKRSGPFAALHGDYRLDNLLFEPGTGDVTAVDWQTAAIGPPLRDVAYFLGTCLHVESRRAHEIDLVKHYHDSLVDRGVRDYSADECWDDYRLGQLQGPMITVIGCIYAGSERTERSDTMFVAMAHRSCAAIRDLDSLELV
jgi:hypothetical protein